MSDIIEKNVQSTLDFTESDMVILKEACKIAFLNMEATWAVYAISGVSLFSESVVNPIDGSTLPEYNPETYLYLVDRIYNNTLTALDIRLLLITIKISLSLYGKEEYKTKFSWAKWESDGLLALKDKLQTLAPLGTA